MCTVVKVTFLTLGSAPAQPGSCGSSGRAWRLWAAQYSLSEVQPLGAQPTPRGLKRAAAKVADVTAFDRQVRAVLDEWQCTRLDAALALDDDGETVNPGSSLEGIDLFDLMAGELECSVAQMAAACLGCDEAPGVATPMPGAMPGPQPRSVTSMPVASPGPQPSRSVTPMPGGVGGKVEARCTLRSQAVERAGL